MTLSELGKQERNLFSVQTVCANVRLQTQKSPKNHRISQSVTLSTPTHCSRNKGRRLIPTTPPPQRVPMNLHTEGGIVQRAVIANSNHP